MNPVRMFTTQVCPYCIRAKQLLKQRGVDTIDEIRVDLNPPQRDAMIAQTGRRTVPQIFIGDTWVGGCDDLIALDQKGGLVAAAERLRFTLVGPCSRACDIMRAAARTVPVCGLRFFRDTPWLNKTNPPFSRSSAST